MSYWRAAVSYHHCFTKQKYKYYCVIKWNTLWQTLRHITWCNVLNSIHK